MNNDQTTGTGAGDWAEDTTTPVPSTDATESTVATEEVTPEKPKQKWGGAKVLIPSFIAAALLSGGVGYAIGANHDDHRGPDSFGAHFDEGQRGPGGRGDFDDQQRRPDGHRPGGPIGGPDAPPAPLNPNDPNAPIDPDDAPLPSESSATS